MKFKINTLIEDYDGETVDIKDQLSGRVIFSLGDNFGESFWWADEEETGSKQKVGIDFYCGPETKEGYVEDSYDCGLYDQLKKLFDSLDLEASIGAAENYHEFLVPNDMEPKECWEIVKNALIEAGAIEKNF